MRQGHLPVRHGQPHENPALAYSEDGRTKTLTLSDVDVAEVAAALARYEAARADLDRAANAGIAALRSRRAARRGEARR